MPCKSAMLRIWVSSLHVSCEHATHTDDGIINDRGLRSHFPSSWSDTFANRTQFYWLHTLGNYLWPLWENGSLIRGKLWSCHLKASWGLPFLTRERTGGPQEAEHLVHHVGVIDRLRAGLLHLLDHLLLPPSLLLLLLLPLSVLFGQLSQTLLKKETLH